MRRLVLGAAAAISLGSAMPLSAATIVVFTDPMTLEHRTVVVDPNGPDRAFMCMLPPAQAGCQPIKVQRGR